ncbi:LuxR C-terminal-related transcriptional regulator [Archangium sp.]|jgi:DNA-binding CsgD family transcriptional regulator|uniref:LuxR C-terminal-related transcriptional regulator n=1 Tax=Archangium sp. TaxID=1872627 RepID=UPI002ED98876
MLDEQELTLQLVEALSSSLELSEVLPRAYTVLSRLLPADYAALCVSDPDRPGGYEWAVAKMPLEFFSHYHEFAHEDFVRGAVARQPNVVLRDSEMLPRPELQRSLLYRRCRELEMPLEHVMAVLLDMKHAWHGGITLYRDSPRPFSERDRALLQRLTPVLASTMRNCKMLGEVSRRGALLESLFHHQGAESIVLRPPDTELMRTARATVLLERWFAPMERGPGGLPGVLREQLARLVDAAARGASTPDTWTRTGPGMELRVSYVPLPVDASGTRPWALVLQEMSNTPPLPESWRQRLTEREVEVVTCVLRGWDNQLIADELGCSLGTVKKHLQRIFDKLGVDSRTALLHRATRPELES